MCTRACRNVSAPWAVGDHAERPGAAPASFPNTLMLAARAPPAAPREEGSGCSAL